MIIQGFVPSKTLNNLTCFLFLFLTSEQFSSIYVLGGVENCGQKIDKEYTFEEGTQSMDLTLCGSPQPKLSYRFKGETKDAEMTQKLDESKKMYKYKINLESINRKDCGSTLTFNATGFKDWQANSTIQIKCIYHEHYIFNFLPGKTNKLPYFLEYLSISIQTICL